MQKKVKWGILGGAGIISKVAPVMGTENSELYAIASQNSQKHEQLKKQYPGAILYDTYEKLLEDENVDAVYIPLPNSLHKEWTIAAANHKKHILCEKTVAVQTSELQEMLDTCAKNNVVLAEAFMLRYSEKFQKLAALLRDGVIGKVASIQTGFYIALDDPANIRFDRSLGGGAMLDLGCYCINLILYVADTLEGKHTYPIQAQSCAVMEKGVDINHVGMLLFEGGVTATFACGFDGVKLPGANGTFAKIIGSKGVIEMGEFMQPGDLTVTTAEGTKVYSFEERSYYQKEVEAVSRIANGSQEPLCMTGEESMRNLNLMQDLLNRCGYYE